MEGAQDMTAAWHRVLVVDDGSILLGALGAALNERGYEVHAVAPDGDTRALPSAIAHYDPDVVLLDQMMLNDSRGRLRRWLRGKAPKFLVLRRGDQPTNSDELRHSLQQPVTVCTPADIQSLLP